MKLASLVRDRSLTLRFELIQRAKYQLALKGKKLRQKMNFLMKKLLNVS